MTLKMIRAGAGVAFARIVGMGMGFLMTVVLARQIGAGGLGVYGYATLLLTLLGVLVTNGGATMLLRATSRSLVNPAWQDVRGMLRWGMGLALGVALLAVVVGALLQHKASIWDLPFFIIPLLGLVLFFDQISALRLAVLRGINQPVWGQLPETFFRPMLIITIFLVLSRLSDGSATLLKAFIAFAIASVLSFLLGTFILRAKAPVAFHQATPVIHSKLWAKMSFVLAGSSALVILNTQIDVILLGFLGTAEDLGLYRIATQVALLSAFGYTTINFILMHKFAYLVESKDKVEVARWAAIGSQLAFCSALVLPVIMYYRGEYLIDLIFGARYIPVLPAMLWLLSAQALNALFGFSMTLLVMHNLERKAVTLTAVGVATNACGCLLLVPALGIEGAAISSFIATGLWNGAIWLQCFKLTGIDSSIFGISTKRMSRMTL